MTQLALAIDTERCTGCQTCSIGCKTSNKVPMNMYWSRTITQGCTYEDAAEGVYPSLAKTFISMSCQHCANAPCQRVCPVGATYRDDKGRIEINYDKCIGCRICMAACPYNARCFNWNDPVYDPDPIYGDRDVPARSKGVVEKCTLCREATDRGEMPMCVRVCPSHARVWGDLDDSNSEISRLAREARAVHLMEEDGTKPQVFYLI